MPPEKPDIFNALSVYREIGIKLGGLEKFEKSLEYFDNALKRDPHDHRALRGRAKSRSKANKFSDALKDIATMKQLDPDNIYTSSYECLVKYLCSEFEQSMVLNISNIPYRKKPDNFVMGAMHCEDAIRNNIGPRGGHPLRDHFKIIRRLAWLRSFESCKPYEPKPRYKKKKKEFIEEKSLRQLAVPDERMRKQLERKRNKGSKDADRSTTSISSAGNPNKMFVSKDNLFPEGSSIKDSLNSTKDSGHHIPPLKAYPFKPIQRYTSNIENLMAERYLGHMYIDKRFLGTLPTQPGIETANEQGSRTIKWLATKSSKYVVFSQELLRMRRPFYFLRLQDAKTSGKLRERLLLKEQSIKQSFENKGKHLIEKIKLAVSSANLRLVINTAEEVYIFCKETSVSTRDEMLHTLYMSIRDTFYDMKRVKTSMSDAQTRLRALIILGLPRDKQEVTTSLLEELECPFENKKKKCPIFEERIRKSISRPEQVWFYHELTRLYFDRKYFDLSRAYATKCLRESYIIQDNKWIVNTMFMIVKNDVAIKNNNGAKMGLGRCRRLAKIINDKELDDFFALCEDILLEAPMEVNQAGKIIEERIGKIMSLLTSDTARKEGALIFQRISSSPPNRRMSVLPGVVYRNNKADSRTRINSSNNVRRRASLRAHKKNQGEEARQARGMSFLGLVQYHKD